MAVRCTAATREPIHDCLTGYSTVTSQSSSGRALPFFFIWMASRSSTRIATRFPRNSNVPSEGDTQRSNGAVSSLSTITLMYVFFNGRIAMRLDPVGSAAALLKSSGRTGSARLTSGSLAAALGDGAAEAIATAGAGVLINGVDAWTGVEGARVGAEATIGVAEARVVLRSSTG